MTLIKRPTRLYEILGEPNREHFLITEPGVCDVFRLTDKIVEDGTAIVQHIGVDGDGRFYVFVEAVVEPKMLSDNFHDDGSWI